jgi:predicted ATPase
MRKIYKLSGKMIKEDCYVITGGPGSGKSTLLNALRQKDYACVDETARVIIKQRLNSGLSSRPGPKEFAEMMFQMDVDNYNNHAGDLKICFFDRSFLDSAALLYLACKSNSPAVAAILNNNRYNNKVFIAPPWVEIYQNDEERDQSYQNSIIVYERLYDWYRRNSYELIIIPKVAVGQRVDFILAQIEPAP